MRRTDQIDFKINILKWDCERGFRWLAPLGTPESFPVRRQRCRSYLNIALVEVFWLLNMGVCHLTYIWWHRITGLTENVTQIFCNCPSFYWENVDYIRDGDKYHFQQQDV